MLRTNLQDQPTEDDDLRGANGRHPREPDGQRDLGFVPERLRSGVGITLLRLR